MLFFLKGNTQRIGIHPGSLGHEGSDHKAAPAFPLSRSISTKIPLFEPCPYLKRKGILGPLLFAFRLQSEDENHSLQQPENQRPIPPGDSIRKGK